LRRLAALRCLSTHYRPFALPCMLLLGIRTLHPRGNQRSNNQSHDDEGEATQDDKYEIKETWNGRQRQHTKHEREYHDWPLTAKDVQAILL
jgi:hypothetical protein